MKNTPNYAQTRLLSLLLLVTMLAGGCDFIGAAQDDDEEGTEEAQTHQGIAVAETGDAHIPLVAAHEDGDWMAVMQENDRVSGASFVAQDGSELVVEIGDSGFPTKLHLGDYIAVLRPAESGRIHVAIVEPDGSMVTARDIDLSASYPDLAEALSVLGKTESNADIAGALSTASLATSIASCAVYIALTTGAAALTGPAAAALGLHVFTACGSALVNTARLMSESDNDALRFTSGGFAILAHTLDTIGCAMGQAMGCVGRALASAQFLAEVAAENERQRANALDLADGALQGGSGDVQVTLKWYNTSDLDLWVTEPSGERIWYVDRNSSTGGHLDIDDINGYGPENVYWPTGQAPQGRYTVQVSHYSGQSPANFDVLVTIGGRSQTYNGTVSDDQVVNVVTFDIGSSSNRIADGSLCDACQVERLK